MIADRRLATAMVAALHTGSAQEELLALAFEQLKMHWAPDFVPTMLIDVSREFPRYASFADAARAAVHGERVDPGRRVAQDDRCSSRRCCPTASRRCSRSPMTTTGTERWNGFYRSFRPGLFRT